MNTFIAEIPDCVAHIQHLLVHALLKIRSCPGAFILRVSDQASIAMPVSIAEVCNMHTRSVRCTQRYQSCVFLDVLGLHSSQIASMVPQPSS